LAEGRDKNTSQERHILFLSYVLFPLVNSVLVKPDKPSYILRLPFNPGIHKFSKNRVISKL